MNEFSWSDFVGVSISDPPETDCIRLGISELHVRHVFIEMVRHLLALGGSIAYGGDLRTSGYTESLYDLVRTYNPSELTGPERVRTYLAWPLWRHLTLDQRAEYANLATIVEVAGPDDSAGDLPSFDERRPNELFSFSRSLTLMREIMNSQIGARVALGGRVDGQQGLLPGIMEESLLALKSEVPLYLLGGFGGCARLIIDALQGDRPRELTIEYQIERTPRYSALLDASPSAEISSMFEIELRYLNDATISRLRNGLDERENGRLFVTDDIDEVVALVLRGLGRLSIASEL